MIKHIHFVSLLFYDHNEKVQVLRTDVISKANSREAALGRAIYRNTLNANFSLIDHNVHTHQYEDLIFSEPLIDPEKAIPAFLKIIETAELAITIKITKDVRQKVMLTNIKELRNHLTPYVTLIQCKKIVELWKEQSESGRMKTSLLHLVVNYMMERGFINGDGTVI